MWLQSVLCGRDNPGDYYLSRELDKLPHAEYSGYTSDQDSHDTEDTERGYRFTSNQKYSESTYREDTPVDDDDKLHHHQTSEKISAISKCIIYKCWSVCC